MSDDPATHFLNVDLRVRAKSGLKELIDAFAPAVFELGSQDPECAVFEVNGTFEELSVDETILAFYNAVQSLPPTARAAWESAESRCFDIGFKCGDHPYQTRYLLSQENIARISSMKGEMAITIYLSNKIMKSSELQKFRAPDKDSS